MHGRQVMDHGTYRTLTQIIAGQKNVMRGRQLWDRLEYMLEEGAYAAITQIIAATTHKSNASAYTVNLAVCEIGAAVLVTACKFLPPHVMINSPRDRPHKSRAKVARENIN